jgi:hypothetical protein
LCAGFVAVHPFALVGEIVPVLKLYVTVVVGLAGVAPAVFGL